MRGTMNRKRRKRILNRMCAVDGKVNLCTLLDMRKMDLKKLLYYLSENRSLKPRTEYPNVQKLSHRNLPKNNRCLSTTRYAYHCFCSKRFPTLKRLYKESIKDFYEESIENKSKQTLRQIVNDKK